MSILVGVGQGQGGDAYNAGVLACQQALQQTGGTSADIVFVFSSVFFDQNKVIEGVRSVSGTALLAGCSTSGEITTNGPTNQSSVIVMAIKSDKMKFYGGVGEDIKSGARAAGQKAAQKVVEQLKGETLRSFIMLPDVLVGNGADIVRGVLDTLGKNFPVVGGAAGDDFMFKNTYQYLNEKIYSGSVVGVGITGEYAFGVGVKHGWGAIGTPMKVTKSNGAILEEVDGRPAIEVYDKYFGDEAKQLREDTLAKLAITYPLGIKVAGSDELLIRDPLVVNENGSITCAAEIPEGSDLRLMIGSKEEAVKMAKKAAENAKAQLEGRKPKAIIIFNCIARKKLFGESSGDEISAIQEVLGREVPLIGFYTYGEQAPLEGEVKNIERCNTVFHNETVVIFVIAE